MRNIKRILTTILVATGIGISGCATADHGRPATRGYRDYARVTQVDPILRIERVPVQQEECWNEEVYHERRRGGGSATPTIVGGVVGAVIGSQFGKGSGKDWATVAGTVLGASIGHDIGRDQRRERYRDSGYTQLERRCRIVETYTERQVEDGYRVAYEYQGQRYVTELPYDPGKRMPVEVTVAPRY